MTSTRNVLLTAALACAAATAAFAQGPAAPLPYGAPATNPAVATLITAPGDRFENLSEGSDGALYATATWNGNLWKWTRDGKAAILSHPAANLQGVVVLEDGRLALTAHDRKPDFGKQPFSFAGLGSKVMVLDKAGKTLKSIDAPESAFLNGFARVKGDIFMAADAAGGSLYRVDIAKGTIEVWLSADAIAGALNTKGAPNGLKVHGGFVYFARTDVYKIAIGKDGKPSGAPVLVGRTGGTDDFDVARDGTVYATHGTDIIKIPVKGEPTFYTKGGCLGGCTATLVSRDGKSLFSAGGSIPVMPNPVAGHVDRSPL